MGRELQELDEAVLACIRGELSFDAALEQVVAYQRRWNSSLCRFWEGRGFVAPHFQCPPGVPTDVFKSVRLASGEGPVARVFRTSGTTYGARGEHHRLSTRAYDYGAVQHFKRMVLPDLESITFIPLVFDPSQATDSSLSHMVELLCEAFHDGDTPRYYLNPMGVESAAVVSELEAARGPVCLFGTAFALMFLFDSWQGRVRLPAGSRVVETGGFKGRSREVSRDELYGLIQDRFGVERSHILSEYSMTELSSQLYSSDLRAAVVGDVSPGVLVAPHWCRVEAADPLSLKPLATGQRGLLRFVDLANTDSVVAIQTSDEGVVHEEGVVLYGRAQDVTPRGCSLAVEEVMQLQGDT